MTIGRADSTQLREMDAIDRILNLDPSSIATAAIALKRDQSGACRYRDEHSQSIDIHNCDINLTKRKVQRRVLL